MYEIKNYMLSMQSHWFINQPLYKAVQETVPLIADYRAQDGVDRMTKTPVSALCKRIYPDIYRVPLFRRQFCKMLVEEIEHMKVSCDRSLKSCCSKRCQSCIATCGLWSRTC